MTTDVVAQSYYQTAVASIPDAPPFGPQVEPYINYLQTLQPGETWKAFVDRVSFLHESARRGMDLHAPIFPDDPSERGKRFWVEDNERDGFDAVFGGTRSLYPATSPAAPAVMEQMVRLMPVWSFTPVNHDPAVADFVWSRPRCFIAGAGFGAWKKLAKIAVDLYPNCPFDPDQTEQAWLADLVEAHKNCGWPVHLACVPWKKLVSAMGQVQPSVPEEWHHAVAVAHVLKHVRRVEGAQTIVVTYRGTVNRVEIQDNSLLGTTLKTKLILMTSLGAPKKGGPKVSHPLADAISWALDKLAPGQLLLRRSVRHLPGQVLHGPWSTTEPDPQANEGFVQHGTRLTGLWVANLGKVNEHTGDDEDVTGYDWNTINPNEFQVERRNFEQIRPDTYAVTFPSDTFFSNFPNLETMGYADLDALKAWFDAPIFASLLRADLVELEREYPFVAFLPSTPTLDESTNQGKTMAALTYARVIVPAIEAIGASDSGSAPDTRSVADAIRRDGTACLDEWRMPKTKSHPLCRENLQLLCTGGAVVSGRVMENSAPRLRLAHSLVACAKGLDFPPDMINRSLVFYLGSLEEKDRIPTREIALRSGKLSLQMRLGAIAIAEQANLGDQLRSFVTTTPGSGYRFHVHRVLAKLIYILRTKKPENGAVDRAWTELRSRFEAHMKDAEDTGVMSSLETGSNLRLRLTGFFDNMTEADVAQMQAYMDQTGFQIGTSSHAWSGTAGLIRARLAPLGLSSRPLASVLPFVSVSRGHFGDRIVVLTLNEDIRRIVPDQACWQLPGHLGQAGWVMWRKNHSNGSVVRLEKIPLSQQAVQQGAGQLNLAPGSVLTDP